MTKLLVTIVWLLAGCLGAAQAQETPLPGRWVGGFSIEGEWTPVAVDFADEGNSGYLFAQDGRPSTLTNIRLEAARVHFETRRLVFDGEILPDGSIFGEVAQGEAHGVFYLYRLAPITADTYQAYIGNYQLEPERLALLARSDGMNHLFYQDTGRQVMLLTLGNDRFVSETGQHITFVRDVPEGDVVGLTIRDLRRPEISSELYAPKVELYREEEVYFSSGEVLLSGTLFAPPTEGPHPGMILVHGAGAAERQLYRVFADHFARQGIAALIYDKRGFGGSTGDHRAAILADLAADAQAGVDLLTTRPEINPAQVGVWGFSQGGRVAPMVAAGSQNVAFVIVVSPPGMSSNLLELWRTDIQYQNAGYPERAAEIGLQYGKLAQDWRKTHPHYSPREDYRERLLAGRNAITADLDPVLFWEPVGQPVLVIYGSEDGVVPPDDSAAVIVAALEKGNNGDATVVVLPEADHNLMVVGTEKELALAPGLLETMSGWVLERVSDPLVFGVDRAVWVIPRLDASGEFGPAGRYGSNPWYGRAVPQLLSMFFCALVFLSAAAGWPLNYLLRRWRGEEMKKPAMASLLAWLVSCLNLVVFIGLGAFVWTVIIPNDVGDVSSYIVPAYLRLLPWLASLAAVLTVGLSLVAAWKWQDARWSTLKRAHYLIVTLAALIFIWFTGYWNLLWFGS